MDLLRVKASSLQGQLPSVQAYRRFQGAFVNLLDAFRQLGPCDTDDSRSRESLESASEIILSELKRLSAMMVPEPRREDVVMEVLTRLILSGPRRPDEGPKTDKETSPYLAACLRNGNVDHFRRNGQAITEELFDVPSDAPSPEAELLRNRWSELLSWAREEFFGRIVPSIAQSIRTAEGRHDFIESVNELRQIADDDATLGPSELKPSNVVEPAPSAGLRFQRHTRARKRIRLWAMGTLRNLPFSQCQKRALAIVACELQPRRAAQQSFAIELFRTIAEC